MGFLRLLESIRNPVLNTVMQIVTYLGEELVFMLAALVIFWCVSKKNGYYVLIVGFFGTAVNQLLKLCFRIPRPWLLDPDFTIVESARAGASGYSFPSGHTQCAVGTFGAVARFTQRRWLRIICLVAAVLVAFSRMYLGVHTPLDVGVSLAIAVLLIFAFYPVIGKAAKKPSIMYWLFGLMLAMMCGYILFVNLYRFPADIDAENLASGVKNGYTLLGALLGLLVTYVYDEKKLHFDVAAPFFGQALKVVLGLAGIIIIKEGLKALMNLVLPGVPALNILRYFCMVCFVGCIWPRTFPLFQKIGRRKGESI